MPPPPDRLPEVLGEWERFLHDPSLPVLIHAGLAHAQFETSHPFLDGNGRVGRLLITFLLCERDVLARPLLYLSTYLKKHRVEYYDRLQAVRERGDREAWLAFFLRGVAEVAADAAATARRILALREQSLQVLSREGKASGNLLRALDHLFSQPIATPQTLAKALGVSYVTANTVASRLVELGVLRKTTGFKRNRRFSFDPYLALFEAQDATASAGGVARRVEPQRRRPWAPPGTSLGASDAAAVLHCPRGFLGQLPDSKDHGG